MWFAKNVAQASGFTKHSPKVQVPSPILKETPEKEGWAGEGGRGQEVLEKHKHGSSTNININLY